MNGKIKGDKIELVKGGHPYCTYRIKETGETIKARPIHCCEGRKDCPHYYELK